jgi:hypothetical protein
MSRRIEIELTSDRGDGTWTWRAAGARQPKGVLRGDLLPAGAKVGDVLRAEIDVDIDGVTVQTVATGPSRVRTEPERIELVGGRPGDEQLVTTQLVGRRDRGDRRDRRDRPPRGERPEGDRREGRGRGDRPRGERPDGERRPRGERPDGERRPRSERPERQRRPAPPPLPERPKPKRLRPGRAHRKAVLAELAPEQQPIAEQVLKGGIPAVRQAIDAENTKRAEAQQPPINSTELLALAEQLLPRLRTADWRDRAEAALADAAELDLRDLRSVVVAADAAARDDETRAMAAQLREQLEARVETEQANWLEDLQLALAAGRVVRALRVSSRPPKAGTMLPAELRASLVEAAGAALTADVGADRWAALLDAAAFAPVHGDVKPASIPESPSDDLLAAVRKYAAKVPGVAAAFGIEAPASGRPSGRSLRPPKPGRRPGTVPVPARRPAPTALGAPEPQAITEEPQAVTEEPQAVTEPAVTEEPQAVVEEPKAVAESPVTPEPAEATSEPVEATSGEPSPPEPEPATTAVPDVGVAEAATPAEETAAEALEAAPDVDDVSDGDPV